MLADGPIFGMFLLEKLKIENSADFRKINDNVFSDDHIVY